MCAGGEQVSESCEFSNGRGKKKSLTRVDFGETFAPAWFLNHCDVNNGDQFGMSTPFFLGEA